MKYYFSTFKPSDYIGNSLAVHWLGLSTFTAVAHVQPLVRNQNPSSHVAWGKKKRTGEYIIQSKDWENRHPQTLLVRTKIERGFREQLGNTFQKNFKHISLGLGVYYLKHVLLKSSHQSLSMFVDKCSQAVVCSSGIVKPTTCSGTGEFSDIVMGYN